MLILLDRVITIVVLKHWCVRVWGNDQIVQLQKLFYIGRGNDVQL